MTRCCLLLGLCSCKNIERIVCLVGASKHPFVAQAGLLEPPDYEAPSFGRNDQPLSVNTLTFYFCTMRSIQRSYTLLPCCEAQIYRLLNMDPPRLYPACHAMPRGRTHGGLGKHRTGTRLRPIRMLTGTTRASLFPPRVPTRPTKVFVLRLGPATSPNPTWKRCASSHEQH